MASSFPDVSATLDQGTWVFIAAVGCLLIIAALVLVLTQADSLDRKTDAYQRTRTVSYRPRDRGEGSIGAVLRSHLRVAA